MKATQTEQQQMVCGGGTSNREKKKVERCCCRHVITVPLSTAHFFEKEEKMWRWGLSLGNPASSL